MTQRILPMGDRVLIRPHTIAPRKSGGLAVPDAQQEEPTTGVVVAVGPDSSYDNWAWTDNKGQNWVMSGNPKGVNVGWTVAWRQHSGSEQTINGETFRTLRLEEIEHRIMEE